MLRLAINLSPKQIMSSRSCPKEGEIHCGECIACAFKKAKIEDKTEYEKPFNEEIPFAYKIN